MLDGYYKWDLFRHQEAIELFKRAKIEDIFDYPDEPFKKFAKDTLGLLITLDNMVNAKKPSSVHILDIYANAERRFEEGKIDDAVLRLYRLVEMIAQERLFTRHDIDVSDVKHDKIPVALREDFIKNYKSQRDGKIKIPLTAAFKLLAELNDETGKIFMKNENEKKFLAIQSSRNHSYLAHGFDCSKDKTYTTLHDFILGLDLIKADEAPVFPKIDIMTI